MVSGAFFLVMASDIFFLVQRQSSFGQSSELHNPDKFAIEELMSYSSINLEFISSKQLDTEQT